MTAASSHSLRQGSERGGSMHTTDAEAQAGEAEQRAVPPNAAELAAGCALSEGFGMLQFQLIGLPATLRAVLEQEQRGKLTAILSTTVTNHVATVTGKLALVPPLLAEWQQFPSLPSAQLLCAQARRLLADVPFTRPFLRGQSRAFHEAVTAGPTEVPLALCRMTQQGIAAAEEQIRVSCHRLVESHLDMVYAMAHVYRSFGIAEDDVLDLIQDGCLGLLAAAERFDVRAGARFRTYATYWLRQAVTRSLRTRRIVLPPRAQQRIARHLTQKTQQLEQLLTRAISPDELAAALGLLPRDIAAALATQRREISLDAPRSDGRSWAEVLAAPEPPDEEDDPTSESATADTTRVRREHR
jgi:RNA polymerase sigma factor (sigma-70 family)